MRRQRRRMIHSELPPSALVVGLLLLSVVLGTYVMGKFEAFESRALIKYELVLKVASKAFSIQEKIMSGIARTLSANSSEDVFSSTMANWFDSLPGAQQVVLLERNRTSIKASFPPQESPWTTFPEILSINETYAGCFSSSTSHIVGCLVDVDEDKSLLLVSNALEALQQDETWGLLATDTIGIQLYVGLSSGNEISCVSAVELFTQGKLVSIPSKCLNGSKEERGVKKDYDFFGTNWTLHVDQKNTLPVITFGEISWEILLAVTASILLLAHEQYLVRRTERRLSRKKPSMTSIAGSQVNSSMRSRRGSRPDDIAFFNSERRASSRSSSIAPLAPIVDPFIAPPRPLKSSKSEQVLKTSVRRNSQSSPRSPNSSRILSSPFTSR